jgi:hypothetical protein
MRLLNTGIKIVITLVLGGCAVISGQQDDRASQSSESSLSEGATRNVSLPACTTRSPERRGLLALPNGVAEPVKGVYYFPGSRDQGNASVYTVHPTLADDVVWSADPGAPGRVLDRMVDAHVNTIVMSYWGTDMPQWSPMNVRDGKAPSITLDAARGKPLVIMPAIESGFDDTHPDTPHFRMADATANSLAARVADLVTIFGSHLDQWARTYDREGCPRFAVEVLHTASNVANDEAALAALFEDAANIVLTTHGLRVGFFLDPLPPGAEGRVHPTPSSSGPIFERTGAILGIQAFESEVFSGLIRTDVKVYDNNVDNLSTIADWKKNTLAAWVATGVPVIADVSNGYDGHRVFGGRFDPATNTFVPNPTGFWGDNERYTDDRFRNWVSEMKGGGIKGIVMDTWNGYTEGYAAVPTVEHGTTVTSWLGDLLEPDPRECSHMHYVNGASTYRVQGAICDKWVALGGDRGFGAPVAAERASARGRVSFFDIDKGIWWSGSTGAHEVHGLIFRTYQSMGADHSYLGLPTTDEAPSSTFCQGGRSNAFEGGWIDWCPDGRVWAHARATDAYPGH